jgi:hypothetical protein
MLLLKLQQSPPQTQTEGESAEGQAIKAKRERTSRTKVILLSDKPFSLLPISPFAFIICLS